jgi:hypothetical protein
VELSWQGSVGLLGTARCTCTVVNLRISKSRSRMSDMGHGKLQQMLKVTKSYQYVMLAKEAGCVSERPNAWIEDVKESWG